MIPKFEEKAGDTYIDKGKKGKNVERDRAGASCIYRIRGC